MLFDIKVHFTRKINRIFFVENQELCMILFNINAIFSEMNAKNLQK